jgi:hypothetical protein
MRFPYPGKARNHHGVLIMNLGHMSSMINPPYPLRLMEIDGASSMPLTPGIMSLTEYQIAEQVPRICALFAVDATASSTIQAITCAGLKRRVPKEVWKHFRDDLSPQEPARIYATMKRPVACDWYDGNDVVRWRNDVLSPDVMIRRHLPGPFVVWAVIHHPTERQKVYDKPNASANFICKTIDVPRPKQRLLILKEVSGTALIAPPGFFRF